MLERLFFETPVDLPEDPFDYDEDEVIVKKGKDDADEVS